MSPKLGVHVTSGGRVGQGTTAEQLKATAVPSSTSSLDGVIVGLGSVSEEENDKQKLPYTTRYCFNCYKANL